MTVDSNRKAKRLALTGMLFGAISGHAASQDLLTTREVVFEKAGEHWWERPKDVRFVRIQVCGGGGGGGGGVVLWPYVQEGGGGGAGSQVHDVVVGPLEAARYQILIGAGGEGGVTSTSHLGSSGAGIPGKPGHESSLKGDDVVFIAAGGTAGDAASGKIVASSFGTGGLPDPATRVGTVHEVYGGGKAESGGASPYAEGGIFDAKLSAGSGGAGLKKGGAAGGKNGDGGVGGLCAGGGGAGAPTVPNKVTTGGVGGPGYLMLVPLVSTDAVESRVRKLLDTFSKGQPTP